MTLRLLTNYMRLNTMDFSHLLQRETVDVTSAGGAVLFSVTVREITNGERVDAQREMFKSMSLEGTTKREINRAMTGAMQSGAVMDTTLLEEVAAIESWTLTDASGKAVPVSLAAWRAMPRSLAAQIERVIERLNPSLDDDTKS